MPRPPRPNQTPVQRLLAASGSLAAILTICAQPTLAWARQKEAEAAQQQPAQEKEAATKEAAGKQAGDGRVRAQPVLPAGQTGTATNPTGAQPTGAAGRPAGATGAQGPAGAQPSRQPITVSGGSGGDPTGAASSQPKQALKPDEISLSQFSEGIDLKVLVEEVATQLQINVIASDALQGSIVLNAPVVVKKSELLGLLDALLEQHGFTIIPDNQTGFYKVVPIDGITVAFESDHATTRIIATPTVRPSSLSTIISEQIGGVTTATPPPAGGGGGGGGRGRITYLDDLGVIVVTDSPRRIEVIQQLVNIVLARAGEQQFIRFNLEHLAASVARTRILELVGKSQQQTNTPPQGVAPQAALNLALGATGNLDNLSDRLIADAQSNALLLRGYPEEEEKIKTLLAILDRPNAMEYKQYFAGSAALQIAQLAERFGFGTTETVETAASQNQPNAAQPGALRQQQPQGINPLLFGQQTSLGGPVLVVDPSRGAITYNGTASQQVALEKLVASFNPQLDIVEFRAYKIKNMPAPDMADLLHGLIFNEEVASRSDTSSPFLSGSRGSSGGGRSYRDRQDSRTNRTSNQINNDGTQNTRTLPPRNTNARPGAGGAGSSGRSSGPVAFNPANPAANQPQGDGVGSVSGNDVFLLADEANNQVVVKATARDHVQISKLIDKLDQRRPQVYIEVQIVAVSATDDFRLAFEVQGIGINSNGTASAVNTNFGLGTFAGTTTGSTTTPGSFIGPKSVITTLAGMTAAIVKSDQVPIIMTALKKNADTRILSSPQLLVDDNEFAEIVSLDEQPTTTTDLGTSTSQTSFGGYESAGTTLSVTPSISEGGYMRLEYEIELSNFVGTSTNGVPPPKQTRNVSSSSVTIPGGATIVVGGIKVDAKNNTIVKVPLLGDIPIIGALFRDTNKANVNNRLYIFITPRIMRDIYGGDLSLLSRGPALESGITPDTPELKPLMIDLNEVPVSPPDPDPAATAAAKREEPEGTRP